MAAHHCKFSYSSSWLADAGANADDCHDVSQKFAALLRTDEYLLSGVRSQLYKLQAQ